MEPLPDPAAAANQSASAGGSVAPAKADSGTGFPVAMIVMGVVALGLLGVIAVLVFQRLTDDTPVDTVVRATPSAGTPAAKAKLCRLDHQARLLAPALNMAVRPALSRRVRMGVSSWESPNPSRLPVDSRSRQTRCRSPICSKIRAPMQSAP